jgi:hypothetical protein
MPMRGIGPRLDTGGMNGIDSAGQDHVGRLLRQVGDPNADTAWRLDALLDLEPVEDPRIAPGLLGILSDSAEPSSIRLAALRYLRDSSGAQTRRAETAEVLRHLVRGRNATPLDLRIQAGLALADYTEFPHVVADLGAVCVEATDSFDVRYAAFTSLQRAGPIPDCIALLRQLSDDETLGPSARSILVSWRSA